MKWTRRHWCASVLAGAAARPWSAHAAGADIVVGHVAPYTVLPVPDASQLNQGMRACFAQVNAEGGLGGRRISLFEVDDTYSAEGFDKAFKQAMQRKPVALLSPVGSVALGHMLETRMLDRADVVILNAIPGAEALRNPGHPKLFHIRAGDRQQIERVVQHVVTLGIGKLVVLYQNIVMGTSGVVMAKAAASATGTLEIVGLESSAEIAAIQAAAQKAAQSDAKAVLMIGSPRFMSDAIAQVRELDGSKFVFALSYAPASLVAKVAGRHARGVALAQTFPNPQGNATPLQREFRAAMKQAHPTLTPGNYTSFHLEGYVSARVFAKAAGRIPDVTPDALAKSLHAMGEYDLGGYRVNFARDNIGSNFVDIGVINAEGGLTY
jgi:ABC-type branched-subunit amino acid transport system substrate-binding protein